MKYDYLAVWAEDYKGRSVLIKRPVVEVTIFGPTDKHSTHLGLIDSGADRSLFHIDVAKSLGVDLSGARKEIVRGIFGDKEVFVLKEVEIQIKHLEKIKIPVSFIDSPYVGVLLGEEGFFDVNKIKFEKDHDAFEINPVRKK